ncbi:type II toxin-antitoxin system VapC family toxin [Sphingomonas oligophenolica]|uniref:Type II toxin-antitoxin system VapC family toxin n=2 Tax=Sphingomonas oligophenolica TaxID=301154 RepID=A0ABU9XXV3_9SPHN
MADPAFMLDSDICIYLLKGASEKLSAKVADQAARSVVISAVTLAEVGLGYGAEVNDAPEMLDFRRNIPVVDFDEVAAGIYATLPFKRGRFDRLIAAHALALGLTLVTNNERDFADIPGLKLENWTR